MSNYAAATALLSLWLGLGSSALADLVTVPAGLSPGDQYRLTFVTSGTTTTTSGDISTYNSFVSSAANAIPDLAALSTDWFVVGSTTTVDARDNTFTNPTNPAHADVPIYTLVGTEVATGNADLWDGAIAAPINTTELGTASPRNTATGTDTDGTRRREFGRSTTSNLEVGFSTSTNNQWIRSGFPGFRNTFPYPVYAMSGVLTVPSVAAIPEASSFLFLAFASAGVGFSAKKRRRRTSRRVTHPIRTDAT